MVPTVASNRKANSPAKLDSAEEVRSLLVLLSLDTVPANARGMKQRNLSSAQSQAEAVVMTLYWYDVLCSTAKRGPTKSEQERRK